MVIARTATRGSTGMLQDKPLKHPARRAVRGSTGWELEDPVKHPAWIAEQGSTGWKQEDPLKHPARSVRRTRTRLLRAVLEPRALATQATVETPAQEHAQRASQARTNLQEAMVAARPAARGSTGWEQEDPVKHRARPVPPTRTRLLRVALVPPAFVMQATRATPAQEHAQHAQQASTRSHRGQPHAPAVPQARIHGKKGPRH